MISTEDLERWAKQTHEELKKALDKQQSQIDDLVYITKELTSIVKQMVGEPNERKTDQN